MKTWTKICAVLAILVLSLPSISVTKEKGKQRKLGPTAGREVDFLTGVGRHQC
jgi:hypothetical protein